MADKTVDKVVDDLMNAWTEFKDTNEANEKRRDTLLDDKLTRLNKVMDTAEGLNQRLTAAEKSAKAVEEVQEQMDRIEATMNRASLGGVDDPTKRKEAVNNWARGVISAYSLGEANLPENQRKALASAKAYYDSLGVSGDNTGGYLAPVEFVREIIKGVTEISAPRSLVRVRPIAGKAYMQPKRTGQATARRVVDQGNRSETDGLRYGSVEINAPEMYALIDISQQNLEDSAFDLEAEIRDEATEQFAVLEGSEFVFGSGVGEMEGVLVNDKVGETVSGAATAVTADGLLTLKHDIKTAYARNATFILNRTTLGSIRKLKDSTGQYLWMPGIAQGKPNSIDGDPYMEVPNMPIEAAGAFPVAYGDFKRAYTMADRITMQMLRDPYTQATNGNIRFLFRRRTGGQIVLAEAIRKLKCAAA
ncbi:HK97 family phage major capsid protein [Azospirillum agricola]|uniref:phage major capsid protein n=1 Tax=Azospirillum agricola TaxID=1720247 RepID=UPI001AE1B35B|nr:phage major capsid protein [Azospirillum agricola]MBP2229657.1 HK97 family phage major capsid protein [Azospirillum agricola]